MGSGHFVPWRRRTRLRSSNCFASRALTIRAVLAFRGFTSRRRDILLGWKYYEMAAKVSVVGTTWCMVDSLDALAS